jgi:WD40 repeat protein
MPLTKGVKLMKTAACLLVIVLLMGTTAVVRGGSRGGQYFSPDSAVVATSEPDCTLILWETATGKKIVQFYEPRDVPRKPLAPQDHICHVWVCSFSHDGRLLATQRSLEPIILWNVKDGRKLASLGDRSHCGYRCHDVGFSSDSRLLVGLGRDPGRKGGPKDRITVWEVATRRELLHVRADRKRKFHEITLSPDGKTLMALEGAFRFGRLGYPDVIRLWDIEKGKELVKLEGPSATFSPNGKFLYVQGFKWKLWDIRAGKMRLLRERYPDIQPQAK